MRIAYPMRVDALDKPGGDVLQVQKYIAAGASCTPAFSGEIITRLDADLTPFDLVHLTNIDRPAELFHFFKAAYRAAKPIVLSPIHHSYSEIERFERTARTGVAAAVSKYVSFSTLEMLRCVMRSASYPGLLGPLLSLLAEGTRKAQSIVLSHSDLVLLLTAKEKNDLAADIASCDWSKSACLRNGFDPVMPKTSTSVERDLDVCVIGRIEARKNQGAILSALESLGLSGVFVGKENPNHRKYCAEFKSRIASSASRHIDGMSHEETLAIMRRSKVHVSASWFEVSSLVDIEAFSEGCKVVSSVCGGTRELLGDRAIYIDPGSPDDLKRAIATALNAAEAPASQAANEPILQSWQSVGASLARHYRHTMDLYLEPSPAALLPRILPG